MLLSRGAFSLRACTLRTLGIAQLRTTPALFTEKAETAEAKTEQPFPPNYPQLLATLAGRIKIPFPDLSLLQQAVTHRSFRHGALPHNEKMSLLGQSIAYTHVLEYVYHKYPNLPANSIRVICEMYAGEESLAAIARSIGLQHVALWKVAEPDPNKKRGETKILSEAMGGLMAAIYHNEGATGLKQFINDHILSRTVDVGAAVDVKDPKKMLSALLKRQGRPAPVSKMLKETGRQSNSSMFLVGVYSGEEVLETGAGQSIKIAETLAAKNALKKHFLKELNIEPTTKDDAFRGTKPGDTPPIL